MPRAAGHPGVSLHGRCTTAMTTREVVDKLANGDPGRVRRIQVRFTKIVLPGDTLTTRAWRVGQEAGLITFGLETVNQNGETVLANALAEVST